MQAYHKPQLPFQQTQCSDKHDLKKKKIYEE